LGAFWALRWLGLLPVGYLVLGLAAGAIHPLAGLFSALMMVAFFGFVAALAITISMRSRSSVRALAATLITLLAWNTVPTFCGSLFYPLTVLFVSPFVLGLVLASYDDVDRFLHGRSFLGSSIEIASVLVFSLAFH